MPLAGLEDWVELRERLAALAMISAVELLALSRTGATVELHYLGEAGRLAATLRQAALDLSEGPEGWTLSRSSAAAAPSLIPAPAGAE